ncbi:MAG: GspH/FimT family pseudopilin [Gemmatimonadales bacterium]
MRRSKSGATLAEIALTLVLIGILAAVAILRLGPAVDRLSVRAASQDVVLALAAARGAATRRGTYVSFVLDPRAGSLRIVSEGETLFERDLAALRGVVLGASRESVTFAPTGLGWGAANTTITVSRGGRADTITTSRLGRVRHF